MKHTMSSFQSAERRNIRICLKKQSVQLVLESKGEPVKQMPRTNLHYTQEYHCVAVPEKTRVTGNKTSNKFHTRGRPL